MVLDSRQINRLLKPLGFSLRSTIDEVDSSAIWKIYSVDSSYEIGMRCPDWSDYPGAMWVWISLENVSSRLFESCIEFVVWEGNCIDGCIKTTVTNPYLGCTTLEEAMIKKDLLGNT